MAKARPCSDCGATIPPKSGPGRQRHRCEACYPKPRPRSAVLRYDCKVCGAEKSATQDPRGGPVGLCAECAKASSTALRPCSACRQPVAQKRPRQGPPFKKCDSCTAAQLYPHSCVVCGEFFVGVQGKKFCSSECRRSRPGTIPKTCEWCGDGFMAKKSDVLYCSKRCRMRSAAHARKLRDPDYHKRNPERKREYQRAYRAANPEKYTYNAYGDSDRQASQRRRARKLNPDGRIEKISYEMLAERDGWRCHLCDKAIDPSIEWPHPMSRSLDHVIPLSKGGEHVLPNCRLAHLECNGSKGARAMGEQLMLL